MHERFCWIDGISRKFNMRLKGKLNGRSKLLEIKILFSEKLDL